MRWSIVTLAVVLAAAPRAGAQPSRLGPRASDQAALASWIADRVERARQGDRSPVRVPLVRVSDGWGCPCPDHYLGADPRSHGGEQTWVQVELAPGVALPEPPARRIAGAELGAGAVYRVDGHFTGEIRHVEMAHGYRYRLAVLRVTRVHGFVRPRARARFRVADVLVRRGP